MGDLVEDILKYTRSEQLFHVPNGTKEYKERVIQSQYRMYARELHPDKSGSKEAFLKLKEFHAQILNTINPSKVLFKSFQVINGKITYETTGTLGIGEIADIYAAKAADIPLALKISRNHTENDLMDNERNTLKELYPPNQSEEAYYRYLPKIYTSFPIRDRSRKIRKVNVFDDYREYFTLQEVFDHHGPLDFRDVVWMWKRALVGLGYVHSKGYVHGAITPDHILIHPVTHGAKLIDWCYSTKQGRPLKCISTKHKHLYPPEVFDKHPSSLGLDLYMLHKVIAPMIADIPQPLQSLLNSTQLGPARRAYDGWKIHDDLTELLEKMIGPPTYRKLEMPQRSH